MGEGQTPYLPTASLSCPSLDERTLFYSSLTTLHVAAAHYLTEADALTYSTTHPRQKSTFYPTNPFLASRSIALTNSILEVKTSTLLGANDGAFTRKRLPRSNTQTFLGFYTGNQFSLDGHVPHTDPSQPYTYCLQLTPTTMAVNGYDCQMSPTVNNRLFGLSKLNEYIWDPSKNHIRIANHGMLYLQAHTSPIPKGTELFVCLGLHSYCWDHYKHTLYLRLRAATTLLADMQGQSAWSSCLTSLRDLSPTTLNDYRHGSPSLESTLLALVDCYSEPRSTASVHITPRMTLLSWLQQLSFHQEFSNHHVFRKADHPQRPMYHVTLLTNLLHSPPVQFPPSGTRRSQRHLTPAPIPDITDSLYCEELHYEFGTPAALLYSDHDLPTLPYIPETHSSPTVPTTTESTQPTPRTSTFFQPGSTLSNSKRDTKSLPCPC